MKTNHFLAVVALATATSLTAPPLSLRVAPLAQAQEADSRFVLPGPTLPAPMLSAQEAREARRIENFLLNTGFPDLSAEIRETLESPAGEELEQINRENLELNWHRLQINNFARELATELLVKLLPQLGNAESSQAAAELTARLLALQPLALPDAFPDAIRNMRNSDQREQAKTQFLVNAIAENIRRHREQILSDSLHAIYGAEALTSRLQDGDATLGKETRHQVQRLDVLINRYVTAMYMDHEMGQGRWLGEALALGLVHHSRISNSADVRSFEARLQQASYAQGVHLSDHISDTLTVEDNKGRARRVRINNGDTVMEWSSGPGARQGSAVPRPHITGRYKAWKHGLITPLLSAIVAADEGHLSGKVESGETLTLMEKAKLWLAQQSFSKKGFSHGGIAAVFKNKDSGVAVIRVMDMYGDAKWGTTRWITPETIYATPGHYVAFGVASLDPKKLLSHLQKQIREKGYQTVFDISDVYRPNGEGELEKVEGESFEWRVKITEEEQRKILDIRPEEAERWYTEVMAPQVVNEMKSNITKYGMVFSALGTIRNKWASYCTEAVARAWLRVTGVNIQSHSDRYFWGLRFLAKFIPGIRSALPTQAPISPNFMAWDPKTELENVRYRPRSPVEGELSLVKPLSPDLDSRVTRLIAPLMGDQRIFTQDMITEASYYLRNFISKAETTRLEVGERASGTDFVPRALPMVAADPEAEYLRYNFTFEGSPSARSGRAQQNFVDSLTALKAVTSRDSQVDSSQAQQSREGLVRLFFFASSGIDGSESRELLIDFIAKMMALKPTNPPRQIPHEIKALPAQQRAQALEKWVAEYTAYQVEVHTRQVLSDVLALNFTDQEISKALSGSQEGTAPALRTSIEHVYTLLGDHIQDIYHNSSMADARVLGSSLVLLLIKEAQTTGNPELLAKLDERLEPYNLKLTDFIATDASPEQLAKMNPSDAIKVERSPGALARARRLAEMEGKNPSVAERLQLRYSPYSEAKNSITRFVNGYFAKQPRYLDYQASQSLRKRLVDRVVNRYLVPINQEQIGADWQLYGSDILRTSKPPRGVARSCRSAFQ